MTHMWSVKRKKKWNESKSQTYLLNFYKLDPVGTVDVVTVYLDTGL